MQVEKFMRFIKSKIKTRRKIYPSTYIIYFNDNKKIENIKLKFSIYYIHRKFYSQSIMVAVAFHYIITCVYLCCTISVHWFRFMHIITNFSFVTFEIVTISLLKSFQYLEKFHTEIHVFVFFSWERELMHSSSYKAFSLTARFPE